MLIKVYIGLQKKFIIGISKNSMIDILFSLYIVIALLFGFAGMIKYKTLLNPLSISIAMFSVSVIIALPFYHIVDTGTPVEYISYTVIISIVYLLFFSLAFFIRFSLLDKLYTKFMVYFKLHGGKREKRYKSTVFISFLLIFVLFFMMLMIQSGAGLLWIQNPRIAYMDYRSGSGHLYAATRWVLLTAFIFYLWFKKPKSAQAIFATLAFSFLAYFFGSKGFILYFWIVFVFYQHYLVRPIKNITLILAGVSLFVLFLSVQLIQGTAKDISDTIAYFTYFDATARFLSIFDQVGLQYGEAFIGQFWSMVPRDLFPSKPYVYGQYLINHTLEPGMLEKGRSTGILIWTKYYLDFGVMGVAIVAFFSGTIIKTFYHYFLLNKDNPYGFIIMAQYGVIALYNYATGIIFIVIILLLGKWLRMWGTYNRRRIILEKQL